MELPKYISYEKDENGALLDGYIFSFEYKTGFSKNQLNISLVLTKDFELISRYSAHYWFEKGADNFQLLTRTQTFPIEIMNYLKSLCVENMSLFQTYYSSDGAYFIEDMPTITYHFKVKDKTKCVSVNAFIYENDNEIFKSEAEKKLLSFHLLINEWTRSMFKAYEATYLASTNLSVLRRQYEDCA